MASKKEETRVVSKVFACLSTVAAVVLLVAGVVLWKAGAFMVSEVNKGLVEQKIVFPPADSPGFEAAVYPDVQKYAGKTVTDGAMAKAFAEDFVAVQSSNMSAGKTLSEVSDELAADPTNMQLQALQGAKFQAETTVGQLVGVAYASWMQGQVMKKAGIGALVLAFVMLVASMYYMARYKRA